MGGWRERNGDTRLLAASHSPMWMVSEDVRAIGRQVGRLDQRDREVVAKVVPPAQPAKPRVSIACDWRLIVDKNEPEIPQCLDCGQRKDQEQKPGGWEMGQSSVLFRYNRDATVQLNPTHPTIGPHHAPSLPSCAQIGRFIHTEAIAMVCFDVGGWWLAAGCAALVPSAVVSAIPTSSFNVVMPKLHQTKRRARILLG